MADTPPSTENRDEEPTKFPLRERFVWLWHPHFWLTLLVVAIVIWVLTQWAT